MIPKEMRKIIQSVPTWNLDGNDTVHMQRRMQLVFMKIVNRIVIRQRVRNRYLLIKDALTKNKVQDRASCKEWVNEDWRKARIAKFKGEEEMDDESDDINKLRYTFAFHDSELGILPDLRFPVMYESAISEMMVTLDAKPVTFFDDVEPYEEIEQLDFECYDFYKRLHNNPISFWEPKVDENNNRPGCEYETRLRQRCGEPDLEQAR